MTCDLARLVSELRQLFDLGCLQAAGTLHTQLDWQRGDDGRVAVNATEHDRQPGPGHGAGSRWRESRLQATLSLGGRNGRTTTEPAFARDVLSCPRPLIVWNCSCSSRWPIPDVTRCGPSAERCAATWLTGWRACARSCPVMPVDGSGSMQLEFTSRISPQQLGCQATGVSRGAAAVQFVAASVSTSKPSMWSWRVLGLPVSGKGMFPTRCFNPRRWPSVQRMWRGTWSRQQPRLDAATCRSAPIWRGCIHPGKSPSAQQNWRMAGTAQGQVSLVQHAGSTKARWSIDLAGAELARRTGTTAARHGRT